MNLTDYRDITALLQRHGFRFSKSMGQNFLTAAWVPQQISAESGITAADGALEIGPGVGCLTAELAKTAGRVTAVELDERLRGVLGETLADFDNVSVVFADALKADLPAICAETLGERPWKVCANLPYNVATPILLTLLERFDNLGTFLVMVQKEVADRLSEKPGSKIYGTPSVKLAWYGTAERVGVIGRNVFWPAPNVDSALVLFKRYPGGHTPAADNADGSVVDRETVFRLIDAAFGQRRKTLHAALKKIVPSEAFEKAGIDPTRRGETLTIDEFVALARALDEVFAS